VPIDIEASLTGSGWAMMIEGRHHLPAIALTPRICALLSRRFASALSFFMCIIHLFRSFHHSRRILGRDRPQKTRPDNGEWGELYRDFGRLQPV